MGFVRARRVFKIIWDDDSDLHGLEIRAKSVPMGEFLEFREYADKVDEGDVPATRRLLELFATVLMSWNLETQDDDGPVEAVPATLEGLYSQDLEFVLAVILKWMSVAAGVSDDLGKESTSGVQFPEASIPMDVSSIDLPKLIEQTSS